MKYSILPIPLLFCLISATNNLVGQKLYGGSDLSYNLSMASQNIANNVNIYPGQTSRTAIKGSFGKGASISGFVGYWIKPNLAFQMDFIYLNGAHYKSTFKNDTIYEQKTDVSASMLKVAPVMLIGLGENKLKPYLKFGLLCRLFGNITGVNTIYDLQTNITTVTETKYKYGFSWGFMSALGVSRKLNNKFTLFSEMAVNVQTWAPSNGDVTKYTVNGVEMQENLLPVQRNVRYKNSYSTDKNNYSTYKPREELKQYQPFSSVGIKIGFYYTFIKKNNSIKVKTY